MAGADPNTGLFTFLMVLLAVSLAANVALMVVLRRVAWENPGA
jgi:hypothetical protein